MQCIVTCAAGMVSYIFKLISEFFIFDTYHPDNLYLREHECDDPWVLSKPKDVRDQEVWETLVCRSSSCLDRQLLVCLSQFPI